MPPTRAAFRADDLAGERRHFDIVGKLRHVDQTLVSARILETSCDQVLHAEPSHVAERHRLASGLLGFHRAALFGCRFLGF